MSNPIPEIPPRMDKDIWETYVANRVWEKGVGFIVRKNGSYYEAINGSTGKIDYGGSGDAGGVDGADEDAVIEAAIANTTSGIISLKGLDLPARGSLYGKPNVMLISDKDGKLTFESNGLELRFGENDQVLPAGLYRLVVSGDELSLQRNTAEEGDFSTNEIIWNWAFGYTVDTVMGTQIVDFIILRDIYSGSIIMRPDDRMELGGVGSTYGNFRVIFMPTTASPWEAGTNAVLEFSRESNRLLIRRITGTAASPTITDLIAIEDDGDIVVLIQEKGIILTNSAGTITKRCRLNDTGDGWIFENP